MELKEGERIESLDGSFVVYKRPYDNEYYEIYDNIYGDYIILKKEEIIELRKLLNELNF